MSNTVAHFEIPADDVEALVTFYTGLFDWKIEKAPGPMDYWLITTDPEDETAMGGGMMARQHPDQGPMNYVTVEDVAASVAKAQELGAQVIMDKTEIPGIGWFAVITDPQHNCIGMHECPSPAARDRAAVGGGEKGKDRTR